MPLVLIGDMITLSGGGCGKSYGATLLLFILK